MKIPYEHWHGCHNNFFVVLAEKAPPEFSGSQLRDALIKKAPVICYAGEVDGILYVEKVRHQQGFPQSYYPLTIINSDGSLARNCGNGLRIARLAVQQDSPKTLYFAVDVTPSKKVPSQDAPTSLIYPTHLYAVPGWVQVEMSLEEKAVGVLESAELREAIITAAKLHFPSVKQPSLFERFAFCHLGNDHLVAPWGQDDRDDTQQTHKLEKWAEEVAALFLAYKKAVPNVHLYAVRDLLEEEKKQAQLLGLEEVQPQSFYMIPWERGVGLSSGCGSGAVALSLLYSLEHPPGGGWRGVEMPGGRVWIATSHGDKENKASGVGSLSLLGEAHFEGAGYFMSSQLL